MMSAEPRLRRHAASDPGVTLLQNAIQIVAVELLDTGVHLHDLLIPRKGLADFLRQVPPDERETRFIEAGEGGVFFLRRASAPQDLDFVPAPRPCILVQVDPAVA